MSPMTHCAHTWLLKTNTYIYWKKKKNILKHRHFDSFSVMDKQLVLVNEWRCFHFSRVHLVKIVFLDACGAFQRALVCGDFELTDIFIPRLQNTSEVPPPCHCSLTVCQCFSTRDGLLLMHLSLQIYACFFFFSTPNYTEHHVTRLV